MMKPDDLIGKEFKCFKFANMDKLSYTSSYKDMEGLPAIVKNIHSEFPEYTNAVITIKEGVKIEYHYPTDLIIKQLEKEEEEEIDLEALFKQIKNLK